MGISWDKCGEAGALLGEWVVLNEFIAYLHLGDQIKVAALTPLTAEIITYAPCGFADFASIAIQIGGIGALVPELRAVLDELGFRAMLGGLLTCYSTACVAGMLMR